MLIKWAGSNPLCQGEVQILLEIKGGKAQAKSLRRNNMR